MSKKQAPSCCKCGTIEQPLSANGYGHLFCDPCGEAHDQQVLARWQSFLTTLAEFKTLSAIVEEMERARGSSAN
jgi:hypothetical protein